MALYHSHTHVMKTCLTPFVKVVALAANVIYRDNIDSYTHYIYFSDVDVLDDT